MIGKYSPWCPNSKKPFSFFNRNAKGEEIPHYNQEDYDEELHYPNYDHEGYDSYGYSAYDEDGKYVGIGNGIDRHGWTEDDYLDDYLRGGDLHANP